MATMFCPRLLGSAQALYKTSCMTRRVARPLFGFTGKTKELQKAIEELSAGLSELRQTQFSVIEAQARQNASLDELVQTARHSSADRLALLIDADNTSWKKLDLIMAEVSRHGNAVARRGYGDFTTSTLAPWKEPMAMHAIAPHQSYQNTVGKNSTDSAMIIDAVELLHSGRFDVFCLVTSDSDFTSLAMRIREEGKLVVGVGKEQTAHSFVAACNTFVEIETLDRDCCPPSALRSALDAGTGKKSASPALPTPIFASQWTSSQKKQLLRLRDIVVETVGSDGWGTVDRVGSLLKQRDPAFDPRKLGASSTKLGNLLKSLDTYEMAKGKPHSKVRIVK